MGQTARLRLICDRFIAGHENCDLRRHLDCVPPDTPLRDIVIDVEYGRVMQILRCDESVNRCRNRLIRLMWLSSQTMKLSEELLKKLLAVPTPTVPPPVRAPELSPMDKLVQLLLSETAKREPAPPTPAEPPGLERLLQSTSQINNRHDRGPGSDKYDVTGLT